MLPSNKRFLNYAQRLRRLRFLAFSFLLLLLVPMVAIVYMGYQQLEKNLIDEYQREANKLVQIIDKKLYKKLTFTNTLSIHEFDYYQQVYNPITNKNQQVISPLSSLNPLQINANQPISGLVGFFQYDSDGRFNSPVWPETLSKNDLSKQPLTADDGNSASQQALASELVERKRKALNIYQILSQSKVMQKIIEREYDPSEHFFSIIFDVPEYLIFYRVASFAEQSRVQGYVVERKPYLTQYIIERLEWRNFNNPVLVKLKDEKHLNKTELFFYEKVSDSQTQVTQPSQADSLFEQQLIYSANLQWPYEHYAISLSTGSIPMTSAMLLNGIFILVLIVAILIACFGFYRLGVKQLLLGEQRLNFVSSVTHELKTPLTSIQMYAQMLKEGTVISAEHQEKYYDFIFGESERLTRLINNILKLSALGHQQQNVQPAYIKLPVLQDIINSKVSTVIEKHNFKLHMAVDADNPKELMLLVDQDAFSQVIINITDNAVKFFDHENIDDASRQRIDFMFRTHPKHKHMMQLEIRDYGDGITKEQESKIFELFYRGGNELTRTTQGTGIGLALVHELVLAQQGEIIVERRTPGLAMLISFPVKNG